MIVADYKRDSAQVYCYVLSTNNDCGGLEVPYTFDGDLDPNVNRIPIVDFRPIGTCPNTITLIDRNIGHRYIT